MSRFVLLDDADPTIQYDGEWTIDAEQYNHLENPVAISGQHRTTGNSSLSFSFQGTYFSLYGTMATTNDTISTMSAPPVWECTIDGHVIQSAPIPTNAQNRFTYCVVNDLEPETTHQFTLRAQATEAAPIWVDKFQLLPSETQYWASLSNYDVMLSGGFDSSIRYGPNWVPLQGNSYAKSTSVSGSSLQLDFIGTKVAWITTSSGLIDTQSRGSYSLNGGPPIEFSIGDQQLPRGLSTLFETEELPRNRHTLKVDYEGFGTPLLLHHFAIQAGDFFNRDPRALGPALDGLRVEPLPDPPRNQPSGHNVGAIVGGVVGGVAILLALAGIAAWSIYQRRRRRSAEKVEERVEPWIYAWQVEGRPNVSTSAGLKNAIHGPQHSAGPSISSSNAELLATAPRPIFSKSQVSRTESQPAVHEGSVDPPAYTPIQ
ncbi:hypothetical protein FA15DRAFT_745851 [Coprinopsis marcescibilis]|uniref:Peptidase A1 domain-containing protein n=1 Tax=Coprinopsis marcescibilis TaxID=230819 RepID=A0A5C3KRG0_COPMA|nr:hypothetical protein FA15DRAFT_745851 [Coprinopsis marcescibilis]